MTGPCTRPIMERGRVEVTPMSDATTIDLYQVTMAMPYLREGMTGGSDAPHRGMEGPPLPL